MKDIALPPKPPKLYNPATSLVIAIGVFFGAQILGSILVSFIPVSENFSPEGMINWLASNPWARFLFILTVESITLSLIYFFLKRRKAGFRDIGLNKPQLRHIAQTAGGFVAYLFIYLIVLAAALAAFPGLDPGQKQDIGFDTGSAGIELLPIFMSLVILPPIAEEIVARGFLYGGLRTKLTTSVSALITSLLFAIAHLGGGSGGGLLWVAAIDTFILSLVLCYLRERTGSLWPSIGVHMLKNGLAFAVLFNITQYFR